MKNAEKQIQYQREYYSQIAPKFDDTNIAQGDEHYFALAVLEGLLDFLDCRSVLDIGAGTGRAVRYLKRRKPQLEIKGLEPVAAMRRRAYELGVAESDIIEGDAATKIPFGDGAFDIVIETGVLHHIPDPAPRSRRNASRREKGSLHLGQQQHGPRIAGDATAQAGAQSLRRFPLRPLPPQRWQTVLDFGWRRSGLFILHLRSLSVGARPL